MPPHRKRFQTRHKCDLPTEINVILPRPPPWSLPIIKLWETFRNFFTIARYSPKTKTYFRSYAAILREKKRHLFTPRYRYIIHPFSCFVRIRDVIMCILWLTTFIIQPFMGCFMSEQVFDPDTKNDNFELFNLILNSVVIVDIILSFFKGYCIEQTREIVLEPKRIVKHYLTTYFIPDIIPVISTMTLYFAWWLPLIPQIIIYQFHIFRYTRIVTTLGILKGLLTMCRVEKSVRICLIHCIIALLVVHWWTCLLGVLPLVESFFVKTSQDSDSPGQMLTSRYFRCMLITMCHFYGAGIGHRQNFTDLEMLFLAVMLMTGVGFYVFTQAIVLQLFGMVNISETKYEELLAQVQQYMARNKFQPHLRKRIYMYYNFKFDKKFFWEEAVLASLTEHLRMEVLLYSCKNLIEKVQIFKGLSKAAVGCILAVLKQEIYLPGDVILDTDDTEDTMYFILYGTCSINMVNGKELMHVEDGNHFGDANKMIRDSGQKVFFNFQALEATQIYYLEKKDLKFCCTTHPEIGDRIRAMAKSKMRFFVDYLATKLEEDDAMKKVDDIVMELNKGRILHHGRKR